MLLLLFILIAMGLMFTLGRVSVLPDIPDSTEKKIMSTDLRKKK